MAQSYDHIVKETIQSVVLELLRHTTDLRLTEYQLVYPELPKTLEKEADFVFRARLADGTDELVHLEFQAFNDPAMLARMLLYFGLLHFSYRLPVRQIVFYFGQAPVRMPTAHRQRNVEFAYELIDLEAVSYRAFLESENPEMVILTILSDFEGQTADWMVEQILRNLARLTTNPTDQQRHLRQLEILSVLRKLQPTVIKQQETMAIIASLRIEDDLRYQQGHKKGIEEGREEGIEQGREEGMTSQARRIARNLLREGNDPALIARVTGLTPAQLAELQHQLPQ